jgi:RNA polymerase sigma-70 factor (ECF subfamily)
VNASPTPPVELPTLVAQAAGGDRRAAEALIARYQQRVARFVIAQTSDRTQYEDLCQTIFVKMVLALPRLRDAERFEPWLFHIARNVCRDHLRARLGWRRLFVSYRDGHDAAAEADSAPDLADEAERRMEQLPEAQRALLRRSLDGDPSYAELAKATGSSVAAVKSRLHRARRSLKAIILAGDRNDG